VADGSSGKSRRIAEYLGRHHNSWICQAGHPNKIRGAAPRIWTSSGHFLKLRLRDKRRASTRHTHTNYDELLMKGTERLDARGLVREQIERVWDIWRKA